MVAAILTIKYGIVFFQNSSHNARNAVIPRDLREIQNFPRTPLGFSRHWRSCSEFMFAALPWKVNTLARPVHLLLPRLASFICSWLVKISLLSLVRTVQFDSTKHRRSAISIVQMSFQLAKRHCQVQILKIHSNDKHDHVISNILLIKQY